MFVSPCYRNLANETLSLLIFKERSSKNVNRRAISNLRNRGAGDIVRKRITSAIAASSTGAGTTIPVTSINSDLARTTGTEFASFASRYQEFRVMAIRVTFLPRYNVSDLSGALPLGAFLVGDYIAGNTPISANQLLSDERSVSHTTASLFSYEVTWSGNPNAKLWNATNVAIPTANLYSVVYGSIISVLLTGTVYYNLIIEWIVEFRGSQ